MATAVAISCSGAPNDNLSPLAGKVEVPVGEIEDLLVLHEQQRGIAAEHAECDRGLRPGSEQIAICTVTYGNGITLRYAAGMTSDHQLITHSERG